MIYVIDDDEIMAECIARACKAVDTGAKCGDIQVSTFTNAIEAMQAMDGEKLPSLVFLDILLDGPDGFTFLNEMMSYTDTMKVPVVVVTSLPLEGRDLSEYGVVGILQKDKMTPQEIQEYVKRHCQ